MGQKDITEKVLEDYNDVFADIINGLLFDGVQEIKPEAFMESQTAYRFLAGRGRLCKEACRKWIVYNGRYCKMFHRQNK